MTGSGIESRIASALVKAQPKGVRNEAQDGSCSSETDFSYCVGKSQGEAQAFSAQSKPRNFSYLLESRGLSFSLIHAGGSLAGKDSSDASSTASAGEMD
jgi:hypothetical protein